MYHDQGLIPVKTLDIWGKVNVTLGLPFIRTSPDHGTAYDAAANGTAEARQPASRRCALADQMALGAVCIDTSGPRSYGLPPHAAKKSLGQHFLFDRDLLGRIARAGGSVEGKTVDRGRPSPRRPHCARCWMQAVRKADRSRNGRSLCRRGPARTGRRRCPVGSRFTMGDALKADMQALIATAGGSEPAMIVANLPYNVGTPLAGRLACWTRGVVLGAATMVLMFQKEVAQRICAAPDDEHYVRLAVLAHGACRCRIAMVLLPGAFRPPPKVDYALWWCWSRFAGGRSASPDLAALKLLSCFRLWPAPEDAARRAEVAGRRRFGGYAA